jgi:hypothetical protein
METNLVDAQGRKVQTSSIPCIKYKEFVIPIRTVTESSLAKVVEGGIRPADIIKEIRAQYVELQDRFLILSTLLAVIAKKDPGGDLDRAMSQMGLTLTDYQGAKIYSPNPELIEEKAH